MDFLINKDKKYSLGYIYDYEMEDGFVKRIKISHMYQAGTQHVHHILRCIIDSSMTIPIVGLEKAADIISKEGYCLINLTTGLKGHTLLGYKAEYMPEHKSYKIYVADCNYPWWAGLTHLSNYTNDDTLTEEQKHSSYIMLSSIREDTLLPQIDIYAKGNITPVQSYRCITVVPYHIVKDQPRTIYPLEFTITLAGFSLAFSTIGIAANLTNLFVMFSLGDTDIEEAKADNKELKIIDLPSTGSPVRIICGDAKSGNVSIKLRNKNGGLYKARIMSQNKIIDIDSDLERNKIEEIKLTSLNKRRPIIKRQSTDSKLNIKVKNVIRRKELDLSGRRLKKIKKPENIERPATIRPATSSSSLKRPAKRPLKELKKKDED